MRILLLPPYFTPERMASTHLDHDRYLAFAEKGWEMILYTPTPTRGVTKEIRSKYMSLKTERLYDNMMFARRFSMFGEGRGVLSRAMRYLLCFVKQMWYGIRARNIDIVYLVSTPPIQGMLGAFLKKIKNVPFVYNLQDIFPDSMVGAGMTQEGSLLWRLGRVIENYTYRSADKIIVISEDFRRNLLSKGVPSSKIEVVYNWVDTDKVTPVKNEDNILLEKLGLSHDGKFNVVYAGNFGHAQNIDVILETAVLLHEYSDIQFLLFGQGDTYEAYKKIAENKRLDNVIFLPLQSVDDVKYVYGMGDLGIVSCKPGIGKSAFPSKTWSILAAGVPIVANYDEDTDLEKLIKENNIGVFSPSGDAKKMSDAILCVYNSPEKCSEYKRNARNYAVHNASRKVSVEKYVTVLEYVVNKRVDETTI